MRKTLLIPPPIEVFSIILFLLARYQPFLHAIARGARQLRHGFPVDTQQRQVDAEGSTAKADLCRTPA
jgi:hypothetical protein